MRPEDSRHVYYIVVYNYKFRDRKNACHTATGQITWAYTKLEANYDMEKPARAEQGNLHN